MNPDSKKRLLDKFLNEREGEYGLVLEYLYSDFPDEDSYNRVKSWLETALEYGFEMGKISAHRDNCQRCKKK